MGFFDLAAGGKVDTRVFDTKCSADDAGGG